MADGWRLMADKWRLVADECWRLKAYGWRLMLGDWMNGWMGDWWLNLFVSTRSTLWGGRRIYSKYVSESIRITTSIPQGKTMQNPLTPSQSGWSFGWGGVGGVPGHLSSEGEGTIFACTLLTISNIFWSLFEHFWVLWSTFDHFLSFWCHLF